MLVTFSCSLFRGDNLVAMLIASPRNNNLATTERTMDTIQPGEDSVRHGGGEGAETTPPNTGMWLLVPRLSFPLLFLRRKE